MKIRRGSVASHTGAHEWGAGKVLEVTDVKATIQFSDGITRKIAASHFTTLQPAARTLFVAHSGEIPDTASEANHARQE